MSKKKGTFLFFYIFSKTAGQFFWVWQSEHRPPNDPGSSFVMQSEVHHGQVTLNSLSSSNYLMYFCSRSTPKLCDATAA